MNKELYNNCLICGKEYKRCRVCEENRGTWASWKQFTDCPECFKILTVSEKEIEVPISTDEEGIEVVKTLKPALSPSPNKENKKSRRTVLPNM